MPVFWLVLDLDHDIHTFWTYTSSAMCQGIFNHLQTNYPEWSTHKNLLNHLRKNVRYFLFICEKFYTIFWYNEGPLQLQSCVYKKNKVII